MGVEVPPSLQTLKIHTLPVLDTLFGQMIFYEEKRTCVLTLEVMQLCVLGLSDADTCVKS